MAGLEIPVDMAPEPCNVDGASKWCWRGILWLVVLTRTGAGAGGYMATEVEELLVMTSVASEAVLLTWGIAYVAVGSTQ